MWWSLKGVLAALIVAAAMAAGGPAMAAPNCAVRVAGPGGGAPIVLPSPLDEHTRVALGLSLGTALQAPKGTEWPREEIDAAPPCPVADIPFQGRSLSLQAGSGHAPMRWVKNGDLVIFLAAALGLDQAADVARDRVTGNYTAARPMFVLAASNGGSFTQVVKIYDGQPTDSALAADMLEVLNKHATAFADVHIASGAVSFWLPTVDHRQGYLLQTPGNGAPAALLSQPDGVFFRPQEGGGVLIPASKLLCRASFGDFRLKQYLVMDGRDGGRDMACKFFSRQGWYTVFTTRMDKNPPTQQVFNDYVDEAVGVHPPMAGTQVITTPGGGLDADYTAEWTDREGQRQALSVIKIGSWYIEIRVTYTLAVEADVRAATKDIVSQVRGDIRARPNV